MVDCTLRHSETLHNSPSALPWDVTRVFGLPLACLTMTSALDSINHLIARRKPCFLITANLHYAMLTSRQPELHQLNQSAAMVLADGMPLVWASRLGKNPLPERVTGADLVPAICQQASEKGHRIFFLGGAEGVGHAAAERLKLKFPGLQIVGIASPNLADLSAASEQALISKVRTSGADVLIAALGQPRGEQWISKNLAALGVPVSMQVGASLDFAAGRVSRAPRWVQRSGLEWIYRFGCEPLRLGPRYLQNILYLAKEVFKSITARSKWSAEC